MDGGEKARGKGPIVPDHRGFLGSGLCFWGQFWRGEVHPDRDAATSTR